MMKKNEVGGEFLRQGEREKERESVCVGEAW